MKQHVLYAAATAALLAAGSAAAAPSLTYDFNTNFSATPSKVFSATGMPGAQITAYAGKIGFGLPLGTFSAAKLQGFAQGLGVDSGFFDGGSPQHGVDTSGPIDAVLFDFGSVMTPESLSIGWSAAPSRFTNALPDIRYWIGGSGAINFGDVCIVDIACTSLDELGFSTGSFDEVAIHTAQLFDGNSGRYLLITGDFDLDSLENDFFKISQLVISDGSGPPTGIPEPGSLTLLGVALLGWGAHRRIKG